MPRFLLAGLAALLLILPATAEGHSDPRLRGTVALKSEANDLVAVRTPQRAVGLRVRGSLSLIRVGQRVELRGSTLRTRGNGSRVLARNVSIVSSRPLSSSSSPRTSEEPDDEVELKGAIRSLAPLTVESTTRSVTCAVPAGMSLTGFAVGDFVEITCDLIGGTWTLRKLQHEDADDDEGADEEEDDDSSGGPGSGDDDGDSSGPGGGGDDD